MNDLLHILQETWTEVLEIFPYFAVGIFLEAYIRTKKWHVHIRKALTRFGVLAVAASALLGVMSPLCACGILPLTISLILGGLPLAPAMTLLVSAPLMSPAGYALSLRNLGPVWANANLIAAVFMGIYAGVVTNFFERRGLNARALFRKELPQGDFHDADYPEEELRCHCGEMPSKKVEARGGSAIMVFLAKMAEGGIKVGKYVLLGILIQQVILVYVPDSWIDALLRSGNPLSVLALVLAAVPLHLTQITTTAILSGFPDAAPAAKMALLVGGPVTAIPAMVVFLTLFRRPIFFLYLGICLSGTMIVAFGTQAILRLLGT